MGARIGLYYNERLEPFGGFKQSDIGREFGAFGLDAYLEPKTLIGTRIAS
jgi:aldehyde dehydrogenase (NAD+)